MKLFYLNLPSVVFMIIGGLLIYADHPWYHWGWFVGSGVLTVHYIGKPEQ